ncbi:SusC/RagA family TonB-linked outer membrane protein [Bacteroides uniformis]|uniref:SusC/RagA family TonB-linked outer membrane protein n=1 Tax=Bacteroides uniformis TaxID=820 RepID=UPI00189ACCB3|nr:TonB-dependent receptor [Bacteroides uniformis]
MINVQGAIDVKIWLARLILAFLLLPASVYAQTQKTITGTVIDELGESVIGATVKAINTSMGTITDIDGNFTLQVPAEVKQLTISYVGYVTQTVDITSEPIRVQLKSDNQLLQEVVVVGYGVTRKSDLTGSVSTMKADDFNGGTINSPEQLINGKVSGVQIMSSGGSPSAGSSIRIRGGASLNASNDPLIVVDGVPLENGGITGSGNFMSMINPSDIESMTVLKDASSTAIYGSRASNGVLLITTKKGSGDRLKVSFSTNNSLSVKTQTSDVLSAGQFRAVINEQGSDTQKSLLGTTDTNWTNEIFHSAFATDNNVSVSGKAGFLPFRVSVGYLNQAGILRSDKLERYTGSVVVNPSFFDNHLRLTLNAKGSVSETRFADTGAIYNAASFNPTMPVYSGNDRFGGYFESVSPGGVPDATLNPVGLLNYLDHQGEVKRVIGNFDIDYKFHFLPDLKAHISLGLDYAEGYGIYYCPDGVGMNYQVGGSNNKYGPQTNTNKLFTGYLNYNKNVESIKSNIDVTAGYDYQSWVAKTVGYDSFNVFGEKQGTTAPTDQRHLLISYYGRLNYSFDNRYLLNVTMRTDGTSRFSPDDRWGYFPSVGIGWRLNEEGFMKGISWLNSLKLRVSYGVTGQQEIGNNYGYMPVYNTSTPGAYYLMGKDYIPMLRPQGYISNLKWETTTSWNYGFDFSVLDNRLSGSFDYYTRKTKDLLAEVPVPAGANFNSRMTTNVGNVDSQGLEFTLNATPVTTKDFTWDVSFNATWQSMKVKNLSLAPGTATVNTLVGPTFDSYAIQVLSEGYEPYMFYLYHQLYDNNGKPIEGMYADTNDDGVIDNNDRYRCKSPTPDWILGFSTNLQWKKWTLGFSLRANIGNYVYNGNAMSMGAWETVSYNTYQLNNLNASYLKTGFQHRQRLSDYYLENASFLKMDNISLRYTFGKISDWCSNLYVGAMIQNVFTLTKYSGVDPEVPNGCDNSFYPRPRTFSLSVGVDF